MNTPVYKQKNEDIDPSECLICMKYYTEPYKGIGKYAGAPAFKKFSIYK